MLNKCKHNARFAVKIPCQRLCSILYDLQLCDSSIQVSSCHVLHPLSKDSILHLKWKTISTMCISQEVPDRTFLGLRPVFLKAQDHPLNCSNLPYVIYITLGVLRIQKVEKGDKS